MKLRQKGVGIGYSGDEGEDEEEHYIREKKESVSKAKKEKQPGQEQEQEPGLGFKKRPRQQEYEHEDDNQSHIKIDSNFFSTEHSKMMTPDIIDMRSPSSPTTTTTKPLHNILSRTTRLRRYCEETLKQNDFALDSLQRTLARNSLEIQKDENVLKKLRDEREQEKKLRTFIQKYRFGCSVDDSDELISDINNIKTAFEGVEDNGGNTKTSTVGVVEMVIFNIYKKTFDSSTQQQSESNEPLNELLLFTRELQNILPSSVYMKIIYFIWWPYFKQVLQEGLSVTSVQILQKWTPFLPADFLVLFLINQILLPKLHYILNENGQIAEDVNIILEYWKCFQQISATTSRQYNLDEIFTVLLYKNILNWLSTRITSCPISLLLPMKSEFMTEWTRGNLVKPADLKKLTDENWMRRLERILVRDLEIDPTQQDIEPLEIFFECYSELYTKNTIEASRYTLLQARLLNTNLIPKLVKSLKRWLKSPQVDYEEVAQWYEAWKEIIPADLFECEELREGFGQLLQVIDEHI